MKFEDIQTIWNSQKERAMYVIDLDSLHHSLTRKANCIKRSVGLTEWGLIAVCSLTAAVLAKDPVLNGSEHYKYFGVLLLLGVALWIYRGRQQRLRGESHFDPSLSGDLERALPQLNDYIRLAKTFQWWFMLPAGSIMLLSLCLRPGPLSPWRLLAMIAGLGLGLALPRLDIHCVQLPKKRDLEALRSTLSSEI